VAQILFAASEFTGAGKGKTLGGASSGFYFRHSDNSLEALAAYSRGPLPAVTAKPYCRLLRIFPERSGVIFHNKKKNNPSGVPLRIITFWAEE
jgi:hypothetical protein